MEKLFDQLANSGYERVAQVTTRGQFAGRGGIIDVYSWQAQLPFRLEFFGDQIESLREFDIDTQTSVRDLRSVDILFETVDSQSGFVRDYVADNHLIVDIEPEEISDAHIQISEGWIEQHGHSEPFDSAQDRLRRGIPLRNQKASSRDPATSLRFAQDDIAGNVEDFSGAFVDCDIGEFAAGDLVLAEAKRAQFVDRLKEWHANNARVVIYFQTEGEIERFCEIMSGTVEGVDFVEGTLARGFCFPAANLVVLSAAELFGRFAAHARRHLRRAERHRAQIDFSELNEGDLVVHLEHGIGRFLGLLKLPAAEGRAPASPASLELRPPEKARLVETEVLALEFADDGKLYVPLEQAYLISRYVGAGKKSPPLSSLADGE